MVQTRLPREMTTSMERIHVQEVYDQIAPHFADLKQKAWPKVKQFLKGLEPGSLVADVGCGSGRYLRVNSSVYKIGSDICQPLVHHANHQGHEVITADNLHLPYRDNIFDAVISIGVIHHFSSDAHRIQALKELSRVLSPGGKLMVYVWAFEQKHRRFESQDVLIPWHKPCNPSLRLYRGSCSDLDHSSNSSVSDDDTSSLNSFVFVQDTPPDEVNGFPHRIQSLEDVNQSSEDVFEPEDAELKPSQDGRFDQPCTLVQECRRLEACLKELSEKQLSTAEVLQSNGKSFEFPAPDFNFRRKSGAEPGPCETKRVVSPVCHRKKGAGCQTVPSILPCQSSLLHAKSKLSLPFSPPEDFVHQEHCALRKGNTKAVLKPNIFQKLKMSLKSLVSNHESTSSPHVETAEQSQSVPPYSMCFEDQSEVFAVREFPMSSLPCSEVSDPTEFQLPLTNVVNPGMTRTVSDVSNLAAKKNDHIKLRSRSVKSLPLELASSDVPQKSLPRRRRVQSNGHSNQEQSFKSETKSPLDRNESRKLIVNGFQNDRSRSQSDLQIKGCRKGIKKSEDNLHDFAKVFCSTEDNDTELISGQNKKLTRRSALDSASSDSFLSSASGVSVGSTPTNADLCRYYHVFKEGELGDMVRRNIEDLHIIDTYFDHANWCLMAEKVKIWKL